MKAPFVILAAVAALAAVPTVSAAGRAAALQPLPGFRSPSGNIRCLYVPGRPRMVLCEIDRSRYSGALQARCMSGAGLDWHGFTLGARGKGTFVCTGGILYDPARTPNYATLAYGTSWRQGGFTCTSRVTGVTCRNRTGHGLFVSRATWRAW
jgi:hypothetical protein